MSTTRASARDRTDSGAAAAGTWHVDRERSHVGFRSRKLGLYFVKGRFHDVEGSIEIGPQGAPVQGEIVIQAKSVSTRMPPRDWDLRSREFLDVKRHPEIRVRATSVAPAGEGAFTVPAQISIKGVEKTVELTGHLHAPDAPDVGAGPIGLHLEGELDRGEFGIRAHPPFQWIVGRQVHLDVELALRRQQ